MAEVTGLTAARMLEIEAASIVNGTIVGDNLVLIAHNGSEVTAGNVRGPQGPAGPSSAAIGVFRASSPNAGRAPGSWTKVGGTWTEDLDISNWFDAANGKYQPLTAGYYRVSGIIDYATLGVPADEITGIGLSQLAKNGTLLGGPARGAAVLQGRLSGGSLASFSTVVSMNGSTDYLELFSYVESDGTVAVNGVGSLTGELIGT